MKLLDLLVKNYYELHGSFNSIELSIIGNELREDSKKKAVPLIENCYRLLGYKETVIDGKSYSAQEVCNLRKLWVIQDLEALHKNFPGKNDTWIKDTMKALTGKSKTFYSSTIDTLDDRFIPLANGLYHYYMFENKEPVIIKDTAYDFKTAIAILQQNKIKVDEFMSIKEYKQSLVEYKQVDDIEGYVITSGVCYGNRKDSVTVKQFDKIHKLVLRAVLSGTGLNTPSKLFLSKDEYAFTSIVNEDKYLCLLDIANSRKKSYAELVAEFGVNTSDQMKFYENFGVVGTVVGDQMYYLDGSVDKKGFYEIKITPMNLFLMKVYSEGVKSMEAF